MTTTPRAVGIVRVSDRGDREDTTFHPPADQRQAIEELCDRQGWQLIDCYDEINVSGGALLEDRPGLSRGIAAVLTGGADIVVGLDSSRLWRATEVRQQALRLIEGAGGQVWTAKDGKVSNGTASEEFTGTVITAADAKYRKEIGEKTAAAQRRAAGKGIPPIMLPPGLARDGDQIVLTGDAPTVATAVQMRAEGATIADIRAFLAANGIERSYHGTQSLIGNPMLTGTFVFGKDRAADEQLAGKLPAIVSRAVWERAQRQVVSRGRRAQSDRLLARVGVLRCATCGGRMVVGHQTQNGRLYPFYRCGRVREDCRARAAISAVKVEELVVAEVQRLLDGMYGTASAEDTVATAADELDAAQNAYDAAMRVLDPLEPAAVERLGQLRQSRDEARERHEEASANSTATTVAVTAGDWDQLTLAEQRGLVRAVIDSVVVKPGRGDGRVTITAR